MSDLVLILSLLYCWLFGGSALVLGCASEKVKKQDCQVGFREGNFFVENQIFNHFNDGQ